jgi:hypothetical protein
MPKTCWRDDTNVLKCCKNLDIILRRLQYLEFQARLGDFYDKRKAKFQDNPDLWKQKAITRAQRKAMTELKRSLKDSLLPLLPKE